MVLVRVLGPVELQDEGSRPVRLGSPQRRRLLGALVLHRGEVVASDALAALVWPEGEQPANPANAVQTHIARLRKLLPESLSLTTDGSGYRLELSPAQVDVDRFGDLVDAAAGATDPHLRKELLAEAVGLWRGPPYADLDHPSVLAEVARLQEARFDALERWSAALWDVGAPADALGVLHQLVAEAPLRESAVAHLMRYLVAVGRQSDALRAYTRLREVLAEELGIMPSPALRELEAQVLAQDVPGAEGPSAPGAERPGSASAPGVALPASRFVGRADELGQVLELLLGHPLVTLHGPGGVGKTRLARHVAAAAADRYPDGVHIVDLTSVSGPEGVREAVAVALRVELLGEVQLAEQLRRLLSGGRRLLVLDCCEHVVEQVAVLVEDLVGGPRATDVLATSREPLRVDGERVVRLGPLDADHAVELFVDRMGAAGHPEPDDEQRALVEQICDGLDHLPLAIELAAARTPAVGIRALHDGLDRPFALLRGGRRTGSAHHRSLRDVVEWSYGLLSVEEQEVFRRCSVFAAPVTVDDVVAVLAGPDLPSEDVRSIVPDLAERSLVTTSHTPTGLRYGLLDTLRAFGREVQGGHEPELVDRYLGWARRLADAAAVGQRGRDEHRWARRIDVQLPDLLQAHRWFGDRGDVSGQLAIAAPLGRYAMFRYRVDVVRLVERTAAECRDVVDPNLPEVLACAGTIAWQRGRLDEAEALGRRALVAAERVADPGAARFGHDVLSNVALFRGALPKSRDEASAAVALASAAEDRLLEIAGYVVLGLTCVYAGELEAADEVTVAAARLTDEMEGPLWRGRLAYLRGERWAHVDPAIAVPQLEESVRLAEENDLAFLAGVARHTLVTTAARRLPARAAVASYRPLLGHWHETGAWNQLWVATRGLVVALCRLGWHREAAILLGAHDASPRSATPFGADAAELAAVADELADALGAELPAARAQGAALGDEAAVALALDLTRAAAGEGG